MCHLLAILHEIMMIERNAGNRHKANAYSKACKSLREVGHKIESGKDASKLLGIGKKIALKIDEILATGRLGKLRTSLSLYSFPRSLWFVLRDLPFTIFRAP